MSLSTLGGTGDVRSVAAATAVVRDGLSGHTGEGVSRSGAEIATTSVSLFHGFSD